jgi:hypothetical protein
MDQKQFTTEVQEEQISAAPGVFIFSSHGIGYAALYTIR